MGVVPPYIQNQPSGHMGLDVSSHYPPGAPLPPTSLLIAKLWRSGRLSALVDPEGLREALVDKNVYGRIRPMWMLPPMRHCGTCREVKEVADLAAVTPGKAASADPNACTVTLARAEGRQALAVPLV